MATAANAITTVANVQAYPGYNSAWTTAQVEAAINRASDFIERYCNCSFINTTYTAEKYDGDGTRHLLVDHTPLASVTALSDTLTGGSAKTFTVATELLVYGDEGRVTIKTNATTASAFADDDQNVSITYVAGHGAAIANLPQDIVEAATRLAVAWLIGTSPGIKSEKIGDYAVAWDGSEASLPADITAILDQYRRPATAVI